MGGRSRKRRWAGREQEGRGIRKDWEEEAGEEGHNEQPPGKGGEPQSN